MKKTLLASLLTVALLHAVSRAEAPPPEPPKAARLVDPRTYTQPLFRLAKMLEPHGLADPRIYRQLLYSRYKNGKDAQDPFGDALLVFSTYNAEPPNTILGIKGSFTNEQIIAALKRFYREWRPPVDAPSAPRPKLILACQNWGSGAGLDEALKAISGEFEIAVYEYYPVVTFIEPDKSHPTPNDKRLAEILNGG